MDLTTIDLQHSEYVDFITTAGKVEHIREMDPEDLQGFLDSVTAWNADEANHDNQMCRIGIYNTLRILDSGQQLINAYLVGLDSDGVLVLGGGGGGPVPPFCCPAGK
jgi:hypothetical protein